MFYEIMFLILMTNPMIEKNKNLNQFQVFSNHNYYYEQTSI